MITRFWPGTFLALALAACGTWQPLKQTAAHGPQPMPRPDNIIMILVDDMGFSDIGAFGSEVPTPNIDRLAYNGVRLTEFNTTAKCFPSRASLLTGLYADQVNRGRSASTPMIGGVTIAESLRASGYTTLMVGKHHEVTHPMDRGFERYWGLRDGAFNHFNPGVLAREGEPEPARKDRNGRVWCFERTCQEGYLPLDPDFYSTDAFTDQALSYIDEASESGAPFFLFLSYTAPHDPLQAREEDIAPFRGLYDAGYAAIADARYARQRALGVIDERHPRPAPLWADWDALSDDERAEEIARMEVYAGMIANLDKNVGRIVADLETRGILENTLIIFSSDNGASAERVLKDGRDIGFQHPIGSVGRWASLGPNWAEVSNTPFRYYKNESFQGGVVVPAFVHWPAGGVPSGEIWDGPSHLIDLHPTLLALVGAEYDPTLGPDGTGPSLPGENIAGALLNAERGERAGLIFNRWQRGRMVRSERWKLVSRAETGEAANGVWELYDMSNDRTETRNLAEERPDIVTELATAYDSWRASLPQQD